MSDYESRQLRSAAAVVGKTIQKTENDITTGHLWTFFTDGTFAVFWAQHYGPDGDYEIVVDEDPIGHYEAHHHGLIDKAEYDRIESDIARRQEEVRRNNELTQLAMLKAKYEKTP